MLFGSATLVFDPKIRFRNRVVQDAVLESYLTHLRVLIDLFFEDARKDDDIIASDFFEDNKNWHDKSVKYKKRLKTQRVRINKHLAHLTYARVNKRSWSPEGVL